MTEGYGIYTTMQPIKYGVVPQEVMPETAHSNNTSQMVNLINEKLRLGGFSLREMALQGKKVKDYELKKQPY